MPKKNLTLDPNKLNEQDDFKLELEGIRDALDDARKLIDKMQNRVEQIASEYEQSKDRSRINITSPAQQQKENASYPRMCPRVKAHIPTPHPPPSKIANQSPTIDRNNPVFSFPRFPSFPNSPVTISPMAPPPPPPSYNEVIKTSVNSSPMAPIRTRIQHYYNPVSLIDAGYKPQANSRTIETDDNSKAATRTRKYGPNLA